MKKIYLTRPLMPIAREVLRAHFHLEENVEDRPMSRDKLIEVVRSFDGILATIPDRLDRGVLAEARGLKMISNCAAGLDNIDIQAANEFGIKVCNVPDATTESTADFTFAILLALIRRVREAQDYVKEGKWKGWEPSLLLGEQLHGKTIGILGYGKIGKAVAQRSMGFGLNVAIYSRQRLELSSPHFSQVSLEELFERSDYLSIHLPLTQTTRGIICKDVFLRMKKRPVVINMARGAVIVTKDLLEALENGWIRGAALDVTDPEPISADHPLCHLPNVLIVPHIGSATVECRTEMARRAALNLVDYFYAQ